MSAPDLLARPTGGRLLTALLAATQLLSPAAAGGAEVPKDSPARNELLVTNTADTGEGSLRQAILEANAEIGPTTVTFDPEVFADPQTIPLESELPPIRGVLTIDGYIPGQLWKATGVIVSGGGRLPVFRVAVEGRLTLLNLTVADGCADDGGGIANLGELVVRGVTFVDNAASREGGALVNLGGELTAVNSTFAGNQAQDRGGAVANLSGRATMTNCTFSENSAGQGGGLYSDGYLLLRNSILANSPQGSDCVSEGTLDAVSTRNLIEENRGCGTAISTEDPNLEPLGYYNGPAKTFPVGGGSPAVNLGDNDAAVDENGHPLVWDQRGSGDPRFVAGFTDLGAFEHQRLPVLEVDTAEDTILRGCTRAGQEDCPLRGAIEIANATPEPDVITFDPRAFAKPPTLVLARPLPEVTSGLTLDAGGSGGLTIRAGGDFAPLKATAGVELELVQVFVESGSEPQ